MNNTIISIIIILLTIFFGKNFTKSNVNSAWYECIKPEITPPKYIFPIVWTILYILLGVVLKNILDTKDKYLIILFIVNLLLNILWTYVYFNQRNVKSSLTIILLILLTSIIILYKTNNKLIYTPYVLWIGFASYLNFLSNKKICN